MGEAIHQDSQSHPKTRQRSCNANIEKLNPTVDKALHPNYGAKSPNRWRSDKSQPGRNKERKRTAHLVIKRGEKMSQLMYQQNPDKGNRKGHGFEEIFPSQGRISTRQHMFAIHPLPSCQCTGENSQNKQKKVDRVFFRLIHG